VRKENREREKAEQRANNGVVQEDAGVGESGTNV